MDHPPHAICVSIPPDLYQTITGLTLPLQYYSPLIIVILFFDGYLWMIWIGNSFLLNRFRSFHFARCDTLADNSLCIFQTWEVHNA